jgi:hypothetical protein
MNQEILSEFLDLDEEKRTLEARLKQVKARLEELEPQVVREFEAEGVSKITVRGRTVYLQRELSPKLGEGFTTEDAVEALKSGGFSDLVKESYNYQTIKAFFKERESQGEEPIPDELQGVFTFNEIYRARTRKG